jgi:multidrug efflux pump subunit AcrA (membrane-fusion protein)
MLSRDQLTKLLALSLLTALAALAGACGGGPRAKADGNQNSAGPDAAPEAVQVTAAAAVVRELPRFIEATGSLAADAQTDVAPNVGGRVAAVGVDLGSYVQRGAVLVRLEDADARLRVAQAEAQARQAQSAVRQAEERLGLRPGQTFDPARVAEVQAARAGLDLAEKQLARYERLIESGDVSRSSYDQQRAQRDQLREQYRAALASARQSYAGVQAARAAAQAAESQAQQARKSVTDAVVHSPISGFVAERPADPGEYVSPQSKVATIVRTNPLRLRIDIPEQSIPLVRPGQPVSVTTSAYPDRAFAGRVARVSPNVTAASRTLTVEAEVENGENLLRPGQFAAVRLQLPQAEPAVLVPARAVSGAESARHVFVIRDGRAEQRAVQLGRAEGELVEIKSGVRPDELVATSNLEQLKDGAAVRQ